MSVAGIISSLLSVGIIAGSFSLKVPQIINFVKANSCEGVSMMSYITENLVFTISILYNFHLGYDLKTYAESYIILVQIWAVILLMFYYGKSITSPVVLIGIAGYLAAFGYLLIAPIPIYILEMSFSFNIVLTIYSKLPQIYDNFKRGNVGQLSIITVFLSFAGSLARAFTTFNEVDDILVLSGFLIAAFLNGILLVQCLLSSLGGKKDKTK